MAGLKYENDIRHFARDLFVRTELIVTYVFLIPIIVYFIWSNFELNREELVLFLKLISPAVLSSVILVPTNIILLIRPIVSYFDKILKNEEISVEEYKKARNRFLNLPLTHSVWTFIRWIFFLGLSIAPMILYMKVTTVQMIVMCIGPFFIAMTGGIFFFFFTEMYLQQLINKGVFAEESSAGGNLKLTIFSRLTMTITMIASLPLGFLTIVLALMAEQYDLGIMALFIKVGIIIIFTIIAILVGAYMITRSITDKVQVVKVFLDKIGEGRLESLKQPNLISDELSAINNDVDRTRENLRVTHNELAELNKNLESKVEERTEELQAAMEELEAANDALVDVNTQLESAYTIQRRDLRMAGLVQSTILAREAPKSDLYDIAFAYKPMASVSGDFYDFFTDGNILSGLGLFDVSGHGISSGLITILSRSIISRYFSFMKNDKLNTMFEKINEELIRELGKVDNYLTGILLRFRNDIVEYVNSGHPDPIYKSAKTGKAREVFDKDGKSISDLFLGISLMQPQFNVLNLRLKKGDCLFIYSDCLKESSNDENVPYENTGIMKALGNAPDGSARDILNSVMNDFYKYIGREDKIADDLTAILIKKK